MNRPSSAQSLKSLLTGAGLQIALYGVGIVFGLFLTPYLLTKLGEREYAVFVFAGLFSNWLGLVDFGMTTTASRFVTLYYSQGQTRRVNEIANTALALFAGMGGIVFLLSLAAAFIIRLIWPQTPDNGLFSTVFFIAGSAFAVSKLSDGLLGVINGTLRQDISGLVAFIFRILAGLVTFALLYGGGRVVALVTGNFILAFLNLLTLAFLVKKAYPLFVFSFAYFRKSRVRELLSYSLFTFVNQAGELLIQRSDLIIIGVFLSLRETAHYNLVVVTFISYYVSFTQAMTLWQTNWFTHLLAQQDEKLLEESRRFAYKMMTFITLFFSLTLIFWGKTFIARWIGTEYWDTFRALAVIAAGFALFRGHGEVNIRLLQGAARHQRLAGLVILQGILTILLSVILVKSGWGTMGAALGTVLPALGVHGFVVPLLVCRIFGDRPTRYWGRITIYLLQGLVAFVPCGVLFYYALVPNYFSLAWTLFAALILYAVGIGFLGLSSEERKKMGRFFQERVRRSDSSANADFSQNDLDETFQDKRKAS